MKHYNIVFRPEDVEITIHAGATVFQAAEQAGIILNTVCGGVGTCGKCDVILEPAGETVRACQYTIESDLTDLIPPEARFLQQKILKTGLKNHVKLEPYIIQKLPELESKTNVFGAAVDLGTTTVVVTLLDLTDGTVKATAAISNPQITYGDDVISRISHAGTESGREQLRKAIIECVNSLIGQACQKAGITPADIYELTAAGNTTMNHLFLGFPVEQLGQAPYEAYSIEAHDRTPAEMGIDINPKGNIHTIENIAGFVGSDTTAVALAADMNEVEKMTLAVDIGTNGELILGTKDRLYAASCAAGPALEGARISQGSRAVPGAIETVLLNGDDIDLDVIGSAHPRSICGSGLIDAMAALLDLGIVDSTGRFLEPDEIQTDLSEAILKRLTTVNGQGAFILAHNDDNGAEPVILTQKDVRETQLAKAAIRAGIKLLQKKFGITDSDLDQVLLAGAFGNYIRRESAVRIGLLPNVDVSKNHFIGNAASTGAQMILLSSKERQIVADLAKQIEYIEIAHETEFQMVFAESLMFE